MALTYVATALVALLLATPPATAAPLIVGRELSAYDVIVAGGGVGGLIAATRLAEAGQKVILLERGTASTFKSGGNVTVPWNSTVTAVDVPSLAGSISTAMPWVHCSDTAGIAGCLLGGSGSINALMFVTPSTVDFEHWPAGWKYSDMIKSGAVKRITERNPGETHPSSDGELYDQALGLDMASFLNGAGYGHADAIAEPWKKRGYWSHPPVNVRNSVRAGPAATYLPTALANPNFSFMLESKVVRIIRNGSEATGVEFEDASGQRETLSLRKGGKIVLGAGTLSTPRILFNSGIGPTAQIETVQNGTTNVTLPPRQDWINLPVGENLRDHAIVKVVYNTTAPDVITPYNFTGTLTQPNLTDAALYNQQGKGVLAQTVQRLVFWQTAVGNDSLTRYTQNTVEYSTDNNTFMIYHYLTHGVTSVGSLGIDSDGNTYEIVKPSYTTPGDVSAFAAFLDKFRSQVKATNGLITESSATANISSADLAANTWTSGYHWLSTARMGISNNGSCVTDVNTKVYGTDNIFVVDGSFHPDLPIGNTQAVIALAAEHAWPKILAA
ncbi:GMC oxidoreductase [Pseudohyphozyma bogoriensis]|nr:GMC oxidoreductase [Pseudohyphozyma bogoriensis]